MVFLRGAKAGRCSGSCWSQSWSRQSNATDALDRHRGDLSQAEPQPSSSATQDIPVFIEEYEGQSDSSGVELRHYLHPDGVRIFVFGGHDRLAQSLGFVLEIVEHYEQNVLHQSLNYQTPQNIFAAGMMDNAARCPHSHRPNNHNKKEIQMIKEN